jgi:hypothetical protein
MSRTLRILALATAVVLPSCATWDGHFELLGYSTKPNYDTRFKSIRVPVCKSHTYWTVTPVPGMEMDLTRALVREVQTKTPYRIKQDDADTELAVTIVSFQKNILNYTPFNTVREAETVLTVELFWRDLRTGEILTRPARRLGDPAEPDQRQQLLATADSLLPQGSKPVLGPAVPTAPIPVVDDESPIDPVTKKKAVPIVMRTTAHFRPELGESITTALQRNIDRMAVQIVSAMEAGW